MLTFVKENWGRLSRLFSSNAPRLDFIYFYCTDWQNHCDTSVAAYTYSDLGWVWNNHYIAFCAPWFKMDSLATVMDRYKTSKDKQKVMEYFQRTSGGILFHEIWHMEDLVSSPQTKDHAYQAQPVWDLAKDKGTWWATENADSYHLDAIAIYVQQFYKR